MDIVGCMHACMASDAGWRRVFGCGFNAWVMVDDGLLGRQRVGCHGKYLNDLRTAIIPVVEVWWNQF
jgi:hypothetical protein